jgi:hypothetical protein
MGSKACIANEPLRLTINAVMFTHAYDRSLMLGVASNASPSNPLCTVHSPVSSSSLALYPE